MAAAPILLFFTPYLKYSCFWLSKSSNVWRTFFRPLLLGLLLWNVFENRKRTFSVFKTDRQPYGLENGPFSG